ncbi:hypothetical protein [uncultured Mesotoga sp.]|uniref:hypothetical protein n=1 Tax=uncultured Mesotoga sp. TaxID=1184400 RepID=UPI00259577B1|nr:hypothetical protein [uncultured Mesotoga sp.]
MDIAIPLSSLYNDMATTSDSVNQIRHLAKAIGYIDDVLVHAARLRALLDRYNIDAQVRVENGVEIVDYESVAILL